MDRKGISQLLKSEAVGRLATEQAEAVAANIRSSHPDVDEVDVQPMTTDRARAVVMVKDPRGMELQITEGILTRAAAAVGLEIKS
jgi:hypothetical protein